MKSHADLLLEAVQQKLPTARVFWERAPDPFLDRMPCTLVAESRENPSNRFSMNYETGVAAHPIKVQAQDFVEFAFDPRYGLVK